MMVSWYSLLAVLPEIFYWLSLLVILATLYDAVIVNEVFNLIDEDSSEDEEKTSGLTDVPKKRARRQFDPETSMRSFFYTQ